MPKLNIVIEKEVQDMTTEEVAIYVKQLEDENAKLKKTYDEDIEKLKAQHQKALDNLKSVNYNKIIQDTTISTKTESDSALDFNEMVS